MTNNDWGRDYPDPNFGRDYPAPNYGRELGGTNYGRNLGSANFGMVIGVNAPVVSPVSASINAGATQQFTANIPVTWSVVGGAPNGTITSGGLYTAPISWAVTTAVVQAAAVADPTKSSLVPVAIWSPLSLSGLVLGLEASRLVLADNAAVTTWVDLAGLRNATQATASKKPTYKVGPPPAVQSDGTDDVLTLASLINFTGEFTVYAVGTRTLSSNWIVFGSAAAGSTLMLFNDGKAYFATAANAASVNCNPATGRILGRFRRNASDLCGATATGVAEATVTRSGTVAVDSVFARVGVAHYTASGNRLSTILAYSRYLSNDEDVQVRSYILQQEGVAL